MHNDHEFENQQQHILQKMLQSREDAQMSYGQNYRRVIIPYAIYISEQMEVHQISSPIEMAVMMIQQAEFEDNADVKIMNIMAGTMEILEPS